jgi:hypothetical protein
MCRAFNISDGRLGEKKENRRVKNGDPRTKAIKEMS